MRTRVYLGILILLAFVALLSLPAHAQFTTITMTNVQNGDGLPLALGTTCWVGTNNAGQPIGYRVGSGGQAITDPICRDIISGAVQTTYKGVTLGTLKVADTTFTSPVNVCYKVTVLNTATGRPVLGSFGGQKSGYDCLQPSGATWSFDTFVPNTTPNVVIQAGPTGPPGPVGSVTTGFSWASTIYDALSDDAAQIGSSAHRVIGYFSHLYAKWFEGMRFANEFTTVQAAIDDAGANGTVVLPPGFTPTLASGLTISNAKVTLRCEGGAGVVKGFNGTLLTITGSNVTVDSCELNGNRSAGWTGGGLTVNGADGTRLKFVSSHSNAGMNVYLLNATNATITEPNIYDGLGIALFGETGASGTLSGINVRGGKVDASTGVGTSQHAISFHSTGASSTVRDIHVADVNIIAGTGFCLEAARGSGSNPTKIVSSNNTCKLGNNGNGGISYAGVTDGTITGGTVDANGHTAGSLLEMFNSLGVNASGVNIDCTNTATLGVSINSSSKSTLAAGTVKNCATDQVYVGSSVASSTTSDNIVATSVITLPAGVATAKGIHFQSNNASATVAGNGAIGNTIRGDDTVGQTAMFADRAAGTLSRTRFVANDVDHVTTGLNQNSDDLTYTNGNVYGANVTSQSGGSGTNSRKFEQSSSRWEGTNGFVISNGAGTSVKLNALQVGTNGTSVGTIIVGSGTPSSFGTIASPGCVTATLAVTNSSTTNFGIMASPRSSLGSTSLALGVPTVSPAGTLNIPLCNFSGASITPTASVAWGYTIFQ